MEGTDNLADYVKQLVPAAIDRATVADRKVQVQSALEKYGVGVVTTIEAGSFSHGTAIKDKADIDMMVWVKIAEKPSLPSSALSRFRSALSEGLSVQSVNVS